MASIVPGIREILGNMPDTAIFHQPLDYAVVEGLKIGDEIPVAGEIRSLTLTRSFLICIGFAMGEILWNPLLRFAFPESFCNRNYRRFAKWCSRTFKKSKVLDPEDPNNEDDMELEVVVTKKGANARPLSEVDHSSSGGRSIIWAAATRKLILQQRVLRSFRSDQAQNQLLTRVSSSHIGKRVLHSLSVDRKASSEALLGIDEIDSNDPDDIPLKVTMIGDIDGGLLKPSSHDEEKSLAAQAMWRTGAEKVKLAKKAVDAFKEAGQTTPSEERSLLAQNSDDKLANGDARG